MDLADALKKRLEAQADVFASVARHRTITGTGRERALAALLRELLPRRLDVLTGGIAVVDAAGAQKTPSQVDLMIVDVFNFPVLARDADMAIVLPESVVATIEVKSAMSGPEAFRAAVVQVGESSAEHVLGRGWPAFIFSYEYPREAANLKEQIDALVAYRDALQSDLDNNRVEPAKVVATKKVLSSLRAAVLPEMIVSADGPIAIKIQDAGGGLAYDLSSVPRGGAAALALVTELLGPVLKPAK